MKKRLKEDFKSGKEIMVTIQKCLQKEKVISYKIMTP
jgi:hypothetical protein